MYLFLIIIIPLIGTMLGSFLAIFIKQINLKIEAIMLGFASGVMVAASIWSLLIPAIEKCEYLKRLSFIPAVVGFFLGALLIVIFDFIEKKSNNKKSRNEKLIFAVLIHNIPEGLAVGVCAALAMKSSLDVLMIEALIFSIGISVQNIPEGMIVSMPLDNYNSLKKQLSSGFISGIVEPISALIAFLLSSFVSVVLPYCLAFAAGCMIFVVVNDLLTNDNVVGLSNYLSISFSIGFCIMMVLDVIFS